MLFTEHRVLGLFQLGGFVTPTLPNSFLLLFMRMLWVVPLMAALAPTLHPPIWRDIGRLRQREQRSLLGQAIACGGLMFLYLALLYIAIGMIPTGIALILFFTYPVFTALLSWQLLGDRPTRFSWSIMGLVVLGGALTIPYINTTIHAHTWIGIMTALTSGVTFAGYTVLAQRSFKYLHPVPFTWLSFTITLGLSGVSLLFWNVHQASLDWLPLWIGGLLSALLTFAGHLMNNYGIRLIGATSASMVAATNPALTVLLAWLTIQERLSSLQIAGVVITTFSIALLSRELRVSRKTVGNYSDS
ncbi:MAG: DMT family transporter [Leptolyngbyaceae bacterium]|nr:DMT family transporter [Leptolyngbyaceae bacterium]